jgi:hypothetical protein
MSDLVVLPLMNRKRRKIDSLTADGPEKGDYVEIKDGVEAKMTITCEVGVYLAVEDNGGVVQNATFRSATEHQEIVVQHGNLIYRANEAVKNNIKDSDGQNGSFGNSAVSGGIGIEKGTVKSQTAWAAPDSTFSITISVAGGLLTFGTNGGPAAGAQTWEGDNLEWSFQIMTKAELEAFQAAQ